MTAQTSKSQPENRLAAEKSPYLLQHAQNPVDWYPWGEEAFAKARLENKPIFLSIGYSTCHWCHVMERESFENHDIAALLNHSFVSIKVDREERPDVDQVYMSAIQMMTGSGGWPLTVFMTPDGKPFTGGTYFPPEDRWGRSGMKTLLPRVAEVWKTKREEIEKNGNEMMSLLQARAVKSTDHTLGREIFDQAFHQFEANYDPRKGGFGQAPKFPRSHELSFLLRYWKRTGEAAALEMVRRTLSQMAFGGMYDQLGGGFHRYSTDSQWLIPHFEKMLYDQAILAQTYSEAFQATGENDYAETALEIFQYVLRDMTDPKGGFYSAEDADSEGEEGKFYAWLPQEIERVLGKDDAAVFNAVYGVTAQGNFEHKTSVLHLQRSLTESAESAGKMAEAFRESLKVMRQKLFEYRKKRIHPYKDDKILTSWNGLMISAFVKGGRALGNEALIQAASGCADFLLTNMLKNGKLLRRYRNGDAAIEAFQEDYAFLALALFDLYEATFNARWLRECKKLTDLMLELFWDESAGGFFYTSKEGEKLIARAKEYYDGAVPSGNSIAAMLLIRLARVTGDSQYETKAQRTVRSNAEGLVKYPSGFPAMLMAYDFALGPTREVIITGDFASSRFHEFKKMVDKGFDPWTVAVGYPDKNSTEIEGLVPYLKHQPKHAGETAVYVCKNFQCELPVTDLEKLKAVLNS